MNLYLMNIGYSKLGVNITKYDKRYQVKICDNEKLEKGEINLLLTYGQMLKFENKLIYFVNNYLRKSKLKKYNQNRISIPFSKQQRFSLFTKAPTQKVISCYITCFDDCLKCNSFCTYYFVLDYQDFIQNVTINVKDKDLLYLIVEIDKALFPKNYKKEINKWKSY